MPGSFENTFPEARSASLPPLRYGASWTSNPMPMFAERLEGANKVDLIHRGPDDV